MSGPIARGQTAPAGPAAGLTDTQLRAASLPVTGTFWPVTQPVSGTFWQATQPVSLASLPALATGTNVIGGVTQSGSWSFSLTGTAAVTQSGSWTVTANAGTGTFAISAASLPLPTGASQDATLTGGTQKSINRGGAKGSTTAADVTSTASGVNHQPLDVAIYDASGNLKDPTQVRALTSSDQITVANASLAVTPPTLTKATQGATGLSTQDLKDAGRAIVNAATAIAGVTAVTTEAVLSLNVSRDGVATSALTTIAVTSGKRFRVTHIVVGFISTAAAVLSGRFSLRMNPTGAVTATSPIIATLAIPSGAALAQAGGSLCMTLPDGIEFSGTMQFGLSQVCSVATGTIWASIIGFEY